MRQVTRQHLKIILLLSKLKEKENVTIFKKIKHYLFKLFIATSILKVINTKVEITKKR